MESDVGQKVDVWFLGREFFFGIGNNPDKLLLKGRAMIVLFGIALVALSTYWSRQLFGRRGGAITLVLMVFCPHLLAHSALITSDIAAALGFLIALGAWWKLCHRITPGRIIALGCAAGFLALAKFSAALFAPIALLILIIRSSLRVPLIWRIGSHQGRFEGIRIPIALAGAGITAALLAILIIWSAYGFRYAATDQASANFAKPWSEVLIEEPKISGSTMADGNPPADPVRLEPGIVQSFVGWAREYRLLPEAYLYGLAFTDLHARGRLAYFAGEFRETGWWDFFPVAFVLKTTIPVLLLIGLSLIALARIEPKTRSNLLYRLTPLIVFSTVYGLFAITSHLNIGHRHLLPLYPALFIGMGLLGRFQIGRWSSGVIAILLLWHIGESVRVRPHYLTYFNQFAGGPTGGHRYFVDSSLDWGQGLPDLHAWLQKHHRDEPLYLSSFGSDDPQRFPLNATRIGDFYFDYTTRQILPELKAGTYCISATMLHRVYTQVRGPWSQDYENAYHQFARIIVTSQASPEQLQTFAQLRFGRLCHYLESRPPDAIVAPTFFIYRLNEKEIEQALYAPWDAR